MNAHEIFENESKYTSGLYAKQPIIFTHGKGASIFDINGVEYIDCASGHGVANLGHAHPKITQALTDQSSKLITLFETFYNDKRAELLRILGTLIHGLDRVFLCNSGTESIEAAIKFARLSTGRPGIVAAMRAFHGRTYGSLSATYNQKYRQGFEPLVPGYSHVPFNNPEKLRAAVNDSTAAVILEVVQGEGGVYPAEAAFIEAARQICDEQGALLIIDEVQTGFGRTGKLFAIQHFNVTPDLLCCAKSIAGGVPMGAVLLSQKVKNLNPGAHGSTFGGNPLSCAAGVAALGVILDEQLSQQAAEKGAYFIQKLSQIQSPIIREIRGLGLMIGIELKQKATPYLRALQNRQVLALNAGITTLRFLPPLVITYAQIDQVVASVDLALNLPLSNE